MPRIDLNVPFAEKDKAKQLGARWDLARKVWYVPADMDFGPFTRWMKTKTMNDRIPVECPPEHVPFALKRGAISDHDSTLFVPLWFVPRGPIRHDAWRFRPPPGAPFSPRLSCDRFSVNDYEVERTLIRLCYWLPSSHPAHRTFKNDGEAALYLALSGVGLAVDLYLPGERQAMERLVSGGDWYVSGDGFRCKVWDTWRD